MSLLVACPVILQPDEELIASWDHRPHLCIINGHHDEWDALCIEQGIWRARDEDNPGTNLGCPTSWNFAFTTAQERGIDYVAIVSHSLIIEGGTKRLAELVEEHADERGLATYRWWHCMVLSVALWERIGPFDDGFVPAYYEDMDYCRRMFLAGEMTPARLLPYVGPPEFVAKDERAKTINAGAVGREAHDDNLVRFREKWGGDPNHETYERPWDPSSKGGSNWYTDRHLGVGNPVTARIARDQRAVKDEHTRPVPGSALSAGYAKRLLSWWPGCTSYIPDEMLDPTEPAATFFTTFTRPHHLALTEDECAELVAFGTGQALDAVSPNTAPGIFLRDVPDALDKRLTGAVLSANAAWWQLEVTEFKFLLLRYQTGDGIREHQDMHPGQWRRKLAATFQLSDADDYQGGDLMLRAWHDQAVAPRSRGSVTVFPGWCPHEVTKVTAGTRWSLVAWGYGPPVR